MAASATSTVHRRAKAQEHHEKEPEHHEKSTLEKIEDELERAGEVLTCMWEDLAHWQRDNHYILSGYRPASSSFKKSFKSLTYLHNETVNIYSHLLGAIFSLVLAAVLYGILAPRYSSATTADVYAFSCFFVGCAFCLSMSATFHTICNHSHEVAKFYNVLDYIGIVGLITGSFLPSVYYGFWCRPDLRNIYWTMMIVIGTGCGIVTAHPHFRTPKYRPIRASMFVGMGLSGIIPVCHGLKLFGFAELDNRIGVQWLLLEGFAYILGAGIYAARVPEKWQPGTYDLFGSSHQIFHFLVLVGAALHLAGMVKSFDYLHGVGHVC